MIGGQRQTAAEGGVAVQAGGDVHLHTGIDIRQVNDLVEIILKGHLPSLRAEVMATVQQSAAKFVAEFMRQAAASSKVSAGEFATPDAQAVFQEGLSGAAIKGSDADLELVVAALIRRLEAADEPLMKQVLNLAVPMLPKLSRPQIAFLAFVHYAKKVTLTKAESLEDLEQLARRVLPVVSAGMSLSEPNQQYLAGIGAIVINPVASAPIWLHEMRQKFPFIPNGSLADIRAAGGARLADAVEAYEAMQVPKVFPTLSGTAIGILQLRRAYPDVDLSIWIQ